MSAVPMDGTTSYRPRTRTRRARALSLEAIAAKVIVFGFVVGVTYCASSLAGYTLMEKARKDAQRYQKRAASARQEASSLRAEVNALKGVAMVRDWAEFRGYMSSVASEAPKSEVKVVALAR